jgi:hypothetical protein
MSIDGDRVKIEHQPDTAGTSVWLQVIKKPECVKGIQVAVTMGTKADLVPLGGDFRARIGNCAGAFGVFGEYTHNQLVLRNRLTADGGDSVYGGMVLLDPDNEWAYLNDVIYSQLNNPEEVDGNTYLLTIILDREKNKATYYVEGFGKVVQKISEDLKPGWETFWGIGTRSNDALGSGTVWFGNEVKVLLEEGCEPDDTRPNVKKTVPEHKQQNVDVGIDPIEIKFNEPMNAFMQPTCEDGSCCPKLYSQGIDGSWIEINRLCEFEYSPTKSFIWSKPAEADDLEPGTKYKIVVTQDYFYDLAGNGNEASNFKFTTAPATTP